MREQILLTINSRSVRREWVAGTWESLGVMKHKKPNNPSLNPHEEKVLHLRGQLEVDDDCALELASNDPMVMQRLLAIEANIIAAARARAAIKDDED